MTTFQDFALPEALQHKLDALGFDKPTPVQERAIPAALELSLIHISEPTRH